MLVPAQRDFAVLPRDDEGERTRFGSGSDQNNGDFGGFGGGNQQYATREQVQNGFDNLNAADTARDILGAVTTAGTNGIAATKEAQYETINVMKDAQVALTRELGIVEAKGDSILTKMNECCCQILRGQDAAKYDAACTSSGAKRGHKEGMIGSNS